MENSKELCSIVVTGHIDHGKSTFIGRLLYETGNLPGDKLAQIKKLDDHETLSYPFAHLLDHLEEERQYGITIDTTERYLRSVNRDYLIIDAPGHREFLKNMITGASNADAGVLIVDGEQGIGEQTRQHGYLLHLIGIERVIVLINKMDLVQFRQERFDQVAGDLAMFLGKFGLEPQAVIPISAQQGENLVQSGEKMPWFRGPSLLEALDELKLARRTSLGLRLPIQDVYGFVGKERRPVGRIEMGTLRAGERVLALPQKMEVTIREIIKVDQTLTKASEGECIALAVDSPEELQRGMVLADGEPPSVQKRLLAKIFWLGDRPGRLGEEFLFRCATQQVPGHLARLVRCFDPTELLRATPDASEIRHGHVAEVEIVLERPVVTDAFADVPELGRFVLEQNSLTVAGGIIPS